MANKVLHKKSNQLNQQTGAPKVPSASDISYGEIAINYHDGVEKLFIKNDNNQIISFPTDEQVTASLNEKQDVINDLSTIRSGAALGATAYQKPNSGIPASDLAEGVIPDVSAFITKSVNDLTNYTLKADIPVITGIGTMSVQQKGLCAANGNYSFAVGIGTAARGNVSHAEGRSTTANNIAEHSEGNFNVSNKASDTYGDSGNTQHSVGIGTSTNNKNAHEIMQNGDHYIYGIGGYDGTNPGVARRIQDALMQCTGVKNIISLTKSEYDALANKDSETIYVVETLLPYLPGDFSVSSTKKVKFAKGNIQATYDGSSWAWKFADHQFDYVGNAAANTSINGDGTVSSNGTVDLFGWVGASSTWDGVAMYGISNSQTYNSTDTYGNVARESLKADWGTIPGVISAYGDGWYTLSSVEWNYVINLRTSSATVNGTPNARYTEATINTDGTGVNGVILFPDGVTIEAGEATWGAINNTSDWATKCTTAQWSALESKGCVFLPAAGYRNGAGVKNAGSSGFYWSSKPYLDVECAYSVRFHSLNMPPYIGIYYRYGGFSVRLAYEGAELNPVINLYKGSTPINDTYSKSEIDGKCTKMTEITWSELKALRDNSQLVKGMQYRITDYVTYVSDLIDYARSVEVNQFDIIVVADEVNKLNENARACLHNGNTYFSGVGAKLESWELKYCLDNDTTRFGFALAPHNAGIVIVVPDFATEVLEKTQNTIEINNGTYYIFGTQEQAQEYYGGDAYFCCETPNPEVGDSCCVAYHKEGGDAYYIDEYFEITNIVEASNNSGKGVIYYMKDEWNNECPYDFKNIQFKRYKVTATSKSNLSDLVGTYIATGTSMSNFTVDENQSVWRYTFNTNSLTDGSIASDSSLNGFTNSIYDNVILDYVNGVKLSLNGIVFNGQYCYGNSFGTNCYHNTFGNNCYYNTFGNYCRNNTFGNSFQNNTFGNSCYDNTFGNGFQNNTFGNGFQNNTFGNNCYYNTFGNSFQNNTFGNDCGGNTFGNSCYDNTFGNSCYDNTFGNYCNNNQFGNNCFRNQFGNDCYYNTFGNDCGSNTFGNECTYIRVLKDYVYYIIVENGNKYIDITSTQTTSSSNKLMNFTISQGVNNTTTYKTISHNTLNDAFKTTYQSANSQTIDV